MSTQTATVNKTEKRVNVRYLTVTAMLSAVAYILMFLDFSVPFMPAFIKMDLSELPALIGSFAMGPLCGVVVCLIKNVLHLFITTTGSADDQDWVTQEMCLMRISKYDIIKPLN